MQKGNWTDHNFKAVTKALAKDSGLAVFDFDNTLVYNDLGEACMYHIALQGLLPGDRDEFWHALEKTQALSRPVLELEKLYLDFKNHANKDSYNELLIALFQNYNRVYKEQGMEAAYRWSSILFAFHTTQTWEKISRDVLLTEESTPLGSLQIGGVELTQGIRKYKEIYDLIQVMLSQKWQVLIVTASPQEIIGAVADQWGLQKSDVIGMKLAKNANDEYLPEVLAPMPFQHGKLDILYEFLGKNTPIDFAAGDSLGDKNLLMNAKTGVLIDRGYPEMLKMAKDYNVLIQPQFIKP